MRVASDFRELARRALSGKWVSAVLTTLVASILGADIIERWFKHIRYYQLSNECGEPWKWRQFL